MALHGGLGTAFFDSHISDTHILIIWTHIEVDLKVKIYIIARKMYIVEPASCLVELTPD